jgi:hypothetical protein
MAISPYKWDEATLEAAIRTTIGDPSGANNQRWTQAEITAYANRAANQVVLDTEALVETVWNMTLTASTSEYELPDNFVKDKIVEILLAGAETDVRRLGYITVDEYHVSFSRDTTTEATPLWYWIWNKRGDDPTDFQPKSIRFHPVPNSSSDKIRIVGYKNPNAFDFSANGTTIVEFEPYHCEALVHYVLYLTKLDDDDMIAALRAKALYDGQVSKIMAAQTPRSRSERPRLVPRSSVFTGAGDVHRRFPILPWHRGY